MDSLACEAFRNNCFSFVPCKATLSPCRLCRCSSSAFLYTFIHLSSFRLDFTGYGLFEFAASVFLLCALVYYTTERLTSRVPSAIVIGLHFWPSLLFAVFSIFLARSVNHIRAAELSNPVIRASINDWLVAFTYALVAFIALQIVFLNLAIRSIWSNRKGRQPAVSGVIRRSHSLTPTTLFP